MNLWVCLLATAAMAQPAFDVASVKPGGPVRPDGLLEINLGHAEHGVLTLSNTTLSECIRYAYGLTNEEQIAGPVWIKDRQFRYEIVGKAAPGTTVEQLRSMLQTLLNERFGLEVHREPRKIAHYDLALAKGGPKLVESKTDGSMDRVYYGIGRLAYNRSTMDRFVVLLSRQLKQPVFDKTGLHGKYDIDLRWTADDAAPAADSTPLPDIFTALRQQLGLRLEASKEPLEIIVVDKAEKVPAGN